MSNSRTTVTSRPVKGLRRSPNKWLIVWAVLICLAIGLLVAGRVVFVTRETNSPKRENPLPPNGANKASATAPDGEIVDSPGRNVLLVDDDGQTLWISPTDGPPLDLGYLPPGSRVIIALRASELFRRDEGTKLLNALLPLVMRGSHAIGDGVFRARPDMVSLPRMLIGLQLDKPGRPLMSRVAYYPKPFTAAQLKEAREIYSDVERGTYQGEDYGLVGELAYYFPNSPHADRLVLAPKSLIAEVIDLDGEPPPLPRDMERLHAHTDADRIVTIMLTPNALFGGGGEIWTGEMARLRESLFWFFGDELSAVALSLHWDENFFVELVATPTLDTPPERAARILMDRLTQVPEKVAEYIEQLDPHPYGRGILKRFPAMLRTMVAYTRSGVQNDVVVLRCYLPAVAGHNLLTAAELTLAQPPPASRTVAEATASSAGFSATRKPVADRLKQITTLRFTRDTLESALQQLAQNIGVPIEIRGADLQAEGITKNQSFGIDLQNKPAEEILLAILRLANPDKSASGPDDTRQKLVYVILATGPGGTEQIVVTTRAAAAERGDTLPPVFTQKWP